MKKYLVTGGAGFIGCNFVKHLFEAYDNIEVTVLDKLTYSGNKDNLKELESKNNYKFVEGDIADPAVVDRLLKDADIVVNFAAESHVDRSIMGADELTQTNLHGTYVLLNAAKKHGVDCFLQISTDEVYGSVETGSSVETDFLMPRNPYSATKAGADHLALSYFTTHGLPVKITRSSNNYGPYQYPEKLIPFFLTNALEDKPLPLYGDGLNVRDWLYVRDNCTGIDTVINKGKIGEIYNIGGGNEITNVEITRRILEILDKPESLITYVKDRPGHDKRYSLNSAKLESLGWKPEADFAASLEKTVKWYLDNRDWWDAIKQKNKEYKEFMEKYYKERQGG
ncbi:MAG: dTDP-glucose 4,6-dehydratase [Acidobacteria bacterium]|nr:dTDP-glucose 4,6-dehydratase [Acidobacteriota bacterium]